MNEQEILKLLNQYGSRRLMVKIAYNNFKKGINRESCDGVKSLLQTAKNLLPKTILTESDRTFLSELCNEGIAYCESFKK